MNASASALPVIVLTLPCPFAEGVARLRHSWLENQVLNKTADDVVHLWRLGRWDALDRQFANRVKEAVEVAASLEYGLSPAQLLTLLEPLRGLRGDLRSSIGEAVHAVFRKAYPTNKVEAEIRAAATGLAEAITALQNSWAQERSSQSEEVLRARWAATQARGVDLLGVLRSLPKGVVLP